MSKVVVIALGGNALQKAGEEATWENQLKNCRITADHIAQIVKAGNKVLVAHGNGPQVGRIMLQNEAGKNITPPNPMDVCGAMSEGMIGYHIQQSLGEAFAKAGVHKPVATVVTQVEVNPADKAFQNPTKPVGPFYTEEEKTVLEKEKKQIFKQDANRGFRRVVPSPLPTHIVEIDVVKALVKDGIVPIVCGGGGVPVIRKDGRLEGVEAVIDKDFASEVLAEQMNADVLMILTEVSNVCINYGKPEQKALNFVTADELEKLKAEGHFAPGSMLPKVEAAIQFVRSGKGRQAIITSLEHALDGLSGKNATIITA